MYETPALGDDAWGAAGYLNLPKDLSILNRRGYASTTRKGVPLIYRVAITMSQHTLTGRASARNDNSAGAASEENVTETANAPDNTTLLKVLTCQNNWVMRNAAVKWHAARAAMWRQSGVKKSHLGAYAHEIRYQFDSASQSWLATMDGDGAAFTGGTWDHTEINNGIDEDGFQLRLVGTGLDEDSATTPSVVTIGHSYLQSRRQPDPDSNEGADSTPSNHSLLNATLFDVTDDGSASPTDDIVSNAKDQGDDLPYEVFDGATTNHDITEPVESGRVICGPGVSIGTLVCDIPFGLAELNARHSGSQNQTIVDPVAFGVEVLDIFEMQG